MPSTPPSSPGRSRRPRRAWRRSTASICARSAIVVHGTTIAVNTLIQRTGRAARPARHRGVPRRPRAPAPPPAEPARSATARRPLPLVPRARVAEVRERLRADGSVDTPLDEASGARRRARRLVAQGVEGLVVCLLHSYRNAAHERQAQDGGRARRARAAGEHLVRGLAAGARVRAHGPGGARRLRAAEGAALPRGLRAGAGRARGAGHAATSPSRTAASCRSPPRASRRWRRLLSGPASGVIGAAYVASRGRHAQRDHARHGRHQRGHGGGRGRPAALRARASTSAACR